MGFQILDEVGEPFTINDLDFQAANFWDKIIHPTNYASPHAELPKDAPLKDRINYRGISDNWYDVIGYKIHDGADTWEKVKEAIIEPYTELISKYGMDLLRELGPGFHSHLDLVDHWESKGYTPVTVKE